MDKQLVQEALPIILLWGLALGLPRQGYNINTRGQSVPLPDKDLRSMLLLVLKELQGLLWQSSD